MNTWRNSTGSNRTNVLQPNVLQPNVFQWWRAILVGAVTSGLMFTVAIIAYQFGASSGGPKDLPQAILHATASHGSTNVAVATGQIGEDAEGIFILDYLTGNLQCWVYYPRYQKFGAKFEANITAQLPGTKNAEYLMVTGASVTQQTSGNAKPGGCLVYVTDVKSGMFAAYTMPWNRSMESTGDMQKGPMVCVGGDAFRTPMGGSSSSKKAIPTPTPTKETSKEKAVPK